MQTFLALLGIVLSIALLKYRERMGDFIGQADWMRYVGGVYNFVIIIALFILLWSMATLTGTQELLFRPFLYLLPGAANPHNQQLPIQGDFVH